MKGYLIRYKYQGERPSPKYEYQRFFRALYGYTQVVKKSNGKMYVYYREGVLTLYPYIKQGRNSVIIPDNALKPLVDFFKEGKNPAHEFQDIKDWKVTYYVEETDVSENMAHKAIEDALKRIFIRTDTGLRSIKEVIDSLYVSLDELAEIKLKTRHIIQSNWFSSLKEKFKKLLELIDRSERMVG